MRNKIELNVATIILSNKCNLKCSYCSVKKDKPKSLTYEQIKDFIEWYLKQPGKEKKLCFFGGEPLLSFNLIKKTVHLFNSYCKENNAEISDILTNGTIINRRIINYLIKEKLKLICSLDGDKISNIARFGDNEKIFDIIWRNMKKFAEIYGYPAAINMTFYPANVKNLYSNVRFLINNGFNDIKLRPVLLTDKWHKKDVDIFIREFKKIVYFYLKLKGSKKAVLIDPIDDILFYIRTGEGKGLDFDCCLGNKVILGPDGGIYACDLVLLDNEELNNKLRIGYVGENGVKADLGRLDFFQRYNIIEGAGLENNPLSHFFKRRICFSLDQDGRKLKKSYLKNILDIYLAMFKITLSCLRPYLKYYTDPH